MIEPVEREQAIKEVVEGGRHWRELSEFGVTVRVTTAEVQVIGDGPPVCVGATELARGWLRHASSEHALREWARFVHGAVGLVELCVDEDPLGEQLLDGLWRVSFGERISEDMHVIARRVLIAKDPREA